MSARVDVWDMARIDVWTHALRTLVDNDNVDRAVFVLRLDRESRLDNEAADLLEYLDSRRVQQ